MAKKVNGIKKQPCSEHSLLVIEDDRDLSLLICKKLRQKGWQTSAVFSGSEAMARIHKNPYTLLLLDYQLPDMTGKQIIKYLNEQKSDIPFILMTAHNDIKLAVEMMKFGARDFLVKEKGFVNLLIKIVQQVLEQIDTEKKLADAEDNLHLFQSLVNQSNDSIFVIDAINGSFFQVNTQACINLGYNRQELLKMKVTDIEAILPNQFSWTQHSKKVRKKKCMILEGEHRRKDGTTFPVEVNVKYISHGAKDFIVAIARDITERKQVEKTLRNANKETEQLLSSISSILIGVGPDHRITRWNSTAQKTFGIDEKKALGKLFSECQINWDWDLVLSNLSECNANDQSTHLDDIRFTRPDGKEGFLAITVNPIINESKENTGYLLLATDVTEKRHLESQLIQAQKLESIGQLAAGIAHEINTPIQYVGDNTRFLEEAFHDLNTLLNNYNALLNAVKEGKITDETVKVIETSVEETDLEYLIEEIPTAIDQSLDGVERVSKIVRSMKEFSHPGGEEKTAIDINKAIDSTLTVSRNEWKYVAELVTDFDDTLPLVPCFPGDINQVILNIVVNAAHAIADVIEEGGEKKGTITVTTRRINEWVEIRIKDSGTGIPKKIRSKVFDPFFTTKKIGKGTGQGLAISHNVVVEKHGGVLTFETEKNKGTTFVIRLPLKPVSTETELLQD